MALLEFHQRREVRDSRAAKLIQTEWRSAYVCTSNQLTLLDIVVVQSVVRRKFARIEFHQRREVRAARTIQMKWRC
jgi:hypothetical protein